MERIVNHPILTIPQEGEHTFLFNGKPVTGMKGFTIAAALHQAGYPVHSHSVNGRNRSLNCGIGKCGACEMLVDGEVKRICITKVDNVKEVSEITVQNYTTDSQIEPREEPVEIYRTDVAIIGAGPAGLACRETLKELGLNSIVIDSNDKIGGQFLMQTHAFFFFEKERRFGGMRGFDIAKTLAGDDHFGIFLHSTVWDILQNKRIAVKDMLNHKNFYVEAQALIVATGAVPFMPTFENDDVPGVYTAAVVQKMMNAEFTLLGKNILTVGAGNIGYLTSYQLMQAGAKVKAILEAMPHEGGFPVQANRIRRLGIPIYTSHMLLKAIPNQDRTGITGAVVCECENFKPIPGTEKVIDGIDVINICTGLIPDNQLLTKGQYTFGKRCAGVGDAVRIGEGTTAVLRGKQAAYEIAQELGVRFNYNDYLQISKEYIDSQQHPIRIKEESPRPTPERQAQRPFVRLDCLYGFACNPCSFACPQKAIIKSSTSVTPEIDYEKCTGCMQCVSHCPGLAIFGYDTRKQNLFLPVEYEVEEGAEVWLVDDNGKKQGEGIIAATFSVDVESNIAYTVTTPDWITYEKAPATRALATDRLTFQVSEGKETRTGSVVIADADKRFEFTLSVRQLAPGVQMITIPDKGFRDRLASKGWIKIVDEESPEVIPVDLETIKANDKYYYYILQADDADIKSFEGIENFPWVTQCNLGHNTELESIDISGLEKVTKVDTGGDTMLSEINLGANACQLSQGERIGVEKITVIGSLRGHRQYDQGTCKRQARCQARPCHGRYAGAHLQKAH